MAIFKKDEKKPQKYVAMNEGLNNMIREREKKERDVADSRNLYPRPPLSE
jgi:hypothetical protein